MHPLLQQVYDSYSAELGSKPGPWCQLHPGQDERLWSAQDLIEHLVLAARSTSRVLEKRIERGHPTHTRPTFVQRIIQGAVFSLGRLPRGAPAPPFTRPSQLHWPLLDGAALAVRLREDLEQMDRLIDSCGRRFGDHRAASHFLLGPLSADQWRRFHAIHLRHHLEQLRRIEKVVGLPEAHHPVALASGQ